MYLTFELYHHALSSNFEDQSKNTRSTSPWDQAFKQYLIDNRIFIYNLKVKPDNGDKIISRVAAPMFKLNSARQ